jgi:phage replication-related protein YjqB (UPF0714/DUF867 family)
MNDTYKDYRELTKHERKGIDYTIEYRNRCSAILVAAPHGGKIEEYTTELCMDIAGNDLSYYSLAGKKRNNNRSLHIASHRFDEPVAIDAASHADIVVTIHGHQSKTGEFVMIGGRHAALIIAFERDLKNSGFMCRKPAQRMPGKDPNNLCNRGRLGMGVQIEIGNGLRSRLRADRRLRKAFIDAVRTVLLGAHVTNPS